MIVRILNFFSMILLFSEQKLNNKFVDVIMIQVYQEWMTNISVIYDLKLEICRRRKNEINWIGYFYPNKVNI